MARIGDSDTEAEFDRITLNSAPSEDYHVARLADVGSGGGGRTSGGFEQVISDGSSVYSFSIGTAVDPNTVFVQAVTSAASGDFYADYDTSSDDIVITYEDAPPSGQTLAWYWMTDVDVSMIEFVEHNHSGDILENDAIRSALTGGSTLTTIDGDNLSIDQDGSLNASDATETPGINTAHTHIGPMHSGDYHSNMHGIMFTADEGMSIHSAVVDTDLSAVSTTSLPVTLHYYNGGASNPPVVGSTTVTVEGGPERIDLSDLPDIPSDGQYIITRERSPNGEVIPCARINQWTGWTDWDGHVDGFNLERGTRLDATGDDGAEPYYYYFFDMEIGDATPRVTSPWSRDVEEIYMRPNRPEEEFGKVGPRSLWIDTS